MKSGIYGVWVRALILGLMMVLLNGFFRGEKSLGDYTELKKRKDLLARTVEDLKTENEKLATEIDRITHSSEYAKKVLRDKYHTMEPGERLIFFED